MIPKYPFVAVITEKVSRDKHIEKRHTFETLGGAYQCLSNNMGKPTVIRMQLFVCISDTNPRQVI